MFPCILCGALLHGPFLADTGIIILNAECMMTEPWREVTRRRATVHGLAEGNVLATGEKNKRKNRQTIMASCNAYVRANACEGRKKPSSQQPHFSLTCISCHAWSIKTGAKAASGCPGVPLNYNSPCLAQGSCPHRPHTLLHSCIRFLNKIHQNYSRSVGISCIYLRILTRCLHSFMRQEGFVHKRIFVLRPDKNHPKPS